VHAQKKTERKHARNPASPSTEKKQRQRLNLSQEKREAQREKEQFSKNSKCHTVTQEEGAQHKKTMQ
jgi:hypothetical protein